MHKFPVSVAGEENGLPEGLVAKLGRLGQNHVKSLSFFVDSMADVEIWTQECETTWAPVVLKRRDMFISCATAWKCLGNESALVRLHGVLANTFEQFQSYAW